jgi:hypothetical protein
VCGQQTKDGELELRELASYLWGWGSETQTEAGEYVVAPGGVDSPLLVVRASLSGTTGKTEPDWAGWLLYQGLPATAGDELVDGSVRWQITTLDGLRRRYCAMKAHPVRVFQELDADGSGTPHSDCQLPTGTPERFMCHLAGRLS